MPEAPKFHDESLMPIIMGSPYRIPSYAYENYGIGPYADETLALRTYKEEWASGTEAQNALIVEATQEAGFANFNGLLQQTAAKAVAEIIERESLSSPVMADVGAGAGASAVAIIKAVPDRIKRGMTMLLVDPAKEKLQVAEHMMQEQEVRYEILVGTDIEILSGLDPGSVDILTGVASVHHHARIPFASYARVLKKDGFTIFADWHQDIWEHPARVFEFLKRFDWPKKEEGLANWIAVYPQALNNADAGITLAPKDLVAREQITRFWLAYQNIADRANLGINAIWPLEGHRPVRKYVDGMQEAGFYTEPPHQLLADSSLLQVVTGQLLSVGGKFGI